MKVRAEGAVPPASALPAGTYLNYVSAQKEEIIHAEHFPISYGESMARRSKPIQFQERKTRSGKDTYRVIGTLLPGGAQKRFESMDREEAWAKFVDWQDRWERCGSMARLKPTMLPMEELRECEWAREDLQQPTIIAE